MLYNLMETRKRAGLSRKEAAELFGVQLGTYRNWEQCVNAPRDNAKVKQIADALGVPMEALYGYDLVQPGAFSDLPEQKADRFRYMPLVADIAAGVPTEQDEVLDNVPVPIEVSGKHPHAFLLRVTGSSMNRVLPEGCYALVDPDRRGSVVENKPYAVKINGDMATVKRLRRLADGWELVPDSYDETWQPIALREGDQLYEEMRIIGEVVWYTLPFDWSF